MDIPAKRWFDAISVRRSRRHFDGRQINAAVFAALERVCRDFVPFPEARAILVGMPPDDVLRGAVGTYGKIKGAPAFIAFVGSMDSAHVQETTGYTGEGIVLEATALQLDTCWVGGFFRPEAAAEAVGITRPEHVLAVCPIGYARNDWSLEERIMTGFGRSHRRKPLEEIVTGLPEVQWPPWVKPAVEAARLAPSAVNRQPWRFHIGDQSITVSVDNLKDSYKISKRLDCGIAMLHIETACRTGGVGGTWEIFDPPVVGRFTVDKVKV
ncbi:MAG TPA: nitroreductase family protein [Dissulfurispiraceae bacterium]|nr:nitroreductase family protein [Dissulfurispiraceae bacterium]